VANIYQWSFPNQKLKYAAKILYRSPAGCRIILEDLLDCYKKDLLEAADTYIEKQKSEEDEQKSEYEMHSQEAIKIFVGLFNGKVGFRNLTEAKKTLDEQVDSDRVLLVEKMLAWCHVQESFCEAKTQVFALIEQTKKKLMLSPVSVSLDKTIIEGLFKGVLNGLQSDYDTIVENCKQSTLGIKMDATKNRIDSFFTVAMQPAY